jgi:hypothetical protein
MVIMMSASKGDLPEQRDAERREGKSAKGSELGFLFS